MKDEKVDSPQGYSPQYLEMALRADHREVLKDPDGYGKRTGECGDTVEMYLSVQDNIIKHASFDTDGCMSTCACANTVACMVEAKSVRKAWEISPDDVKDYLETLPEDSYHCAELAVGALYLALANYQEIKQNPWKKMYLKGG